MNLAVVAFEVIAVSMALMIMPLVQTRALQLLCAVSQHAGQQQLQLNPGGIFNVLRRSSHHQASLPLERLQQAVTPQVCAELAARVSNAGLQQQHTAPYVGGV